ncbi:YbgA family protein [Agaribacterium haliotis]|uniref:YbgA family protein n=1 Tax=Agaribacterium haliotis TaxID=2013869 RepID=UPI000BB594BC|nr:DUF1722 domain-containing protein [Agaribacterium haliotis]
MEIADSQQKKIKLGISACLLGENVRYNAGHKRSKYCLGPLAAVFEYQGWCPEVAIGLGVPRETIRLVDEDGQLKVRGNKNPELEVAQQLFDYGCEVGQQAGELAGYILIKGSPSCALLSAKLFKGGMPQPGQHEGMFVRGLKSVQPLLPMEEEGRLHDPVLRENFVARVYAYSRWLSEVKPASSIKTLLDFHARYKYLLMAHSQPLYRQLGRLVANHEGLALDELKSLYIKDFMLCLRKPATRRGHVNVLQHLAGYLKRNLDADLRQGLQQTISAYRRGHVNLAVPATMLEQYLERFGSSYIRASAYLRPYAQELGLRNNI